MTEIPESLQRPPVLYWTRIDKRHRRTGNTQHLNLSTGRPDPIPHFLGIHQDSGSFYLSHLDAEGTFITDTMHDSIQDAMSQAEFEFVGTSATWVQVGSRDNAT